MPISHSMGEPMELQDLVKNNVKARIAKDEVAVSMIVRLVQSIEIANIAKISDFDSLYVDLEHCSFSLETTAQICMASLLAGVTPFVRVPSIGSEYVSRVLDNGALGVIAPHITSARDAEKVVRNAKFPPHGERSVTVGIPHLGFRTWPVDELRKALNDATTVVAMIEDQRGLDNAEEIAAVDGIDILMIGTNDLCADFGIDGQFEHQRVADAYKRTIEACSRHGKTVGIGGLAGKPKLIEQFVDLGARYVSSGADLSFLLAGAKDRAAAIRAFQNKPR
ncbi:HpcH/HpaI aldolase family protein [Chelatococcus asaccharovorans]|uniref:HpcH/HpaI aldolase family protein n=2 Tax=Chelatococcus asaccharovorans TaxID=28210 RepID=UPI00224C64CE|nr:aldolase/citrate lyase family protein [Chelatococcus asaccharovorans]CAH1663031.1 2,4-dihydroxyhept-2-ene-1,7-dioic acid aldolase [Chelatococcus asaccharovorans]CAH1682971.1 2,4-dihydroxyhept-2-ene-1,7-dioic acid aldolase [Chelatococcus asaccharovorans]